MTTKGHHVAIVRFYKVNILRQNITSLLVTTC